MNTISIVITSTLITIAISLIATVFFIKKKEIKYSAIESICKDMEKQIHFNETKFLEQKNSLEISHREEQKLLRNSVYQDGYTHGLTENKKDYLIEITNLKSEHREKILDERNRATNEARSQARTEFELQNKLLSVAIKPYLKIEKDSGFIWDEHKSYVGYQYQLLINGIPAFQPHIVIEKTEDIKEINEDKLKSLTNIALDAAKFAANMYLSGASASALKMGAVVVERVTK